MDKAPEHEEVRKAVVTIIAHLESDWGYCTDESYAFGCPSCEATVLRRKLQSISDFLDSTDD